MNQMQRLARLVARVMHVVERPQHLLPDVQHDTELDAPTPRRHRLEHVGAGRAVDELHRHVQRAVVLAEIEHLHQIRMVQLGVDASFVAEHREQALVARELRQHALQRDALGEAVRTGPPRLVHLRHPARGEQSHQLVRTELLWSQGALEKHGPCSTIPPNPGRINPVVVARGSARLRFAHIL